MRTRRQRRQRPRGRPWRWCVSFAFAGAVATAFVAAASFGSGAPAVPFTKVVVDASNPVNPHTKAAGDIDGDGFADLLAGSSVGDGLFWYAYPSWTKYRFGNGSFTTDMQVGDVDGDGDLDAVVPDDGGLVWFENPRPGATPTGTWTRRLIGVDGAANHDVEVGDVNRDGRLDAVSRRKGGGGTYLWLQNAGVTWTRVVVTTRTGEGTALGDLDGDGDLDIVQNGFWLQTPSNPATGTWVERFVASGWPADVGATVADIDGNGKSDIVLAPSESPGRLSWYSAADPVNGPWVEHSVDPDTSYIHTLKAGDVDLDGDLDIVGAEMHQSVDPDEVSVYVNDGGGASWTQQVVDVTGSHNIRLVDIGSDGDLDIYGANWNDGAPNSAVIEYWRNDLQTRLPLDRWQRHVIDSAKPWRSIFVDSGDLDRDGLPDVVTGGWWYRNPGSSGSAWERRTLGSPLNNMAAVFDADADGDLDVLGTQGVGSDPSGDFAWARNGGSGSFTVLSNVERGSGPFLQGVAAEHLRAGGPLEVGLSWYDAGAGIQALTVPASPSTETWRMRTVSPVSQGEGLTSADIDRDGDRDLVLGTKWLRQDGTAWTPLDIRTSAEEPDRNRVADVNGDGRLDVVVGFEVSSPQGKVAWYEQPATPGGAWVEHLIATVIGPLSLDTADMDRDGDVDVVVGEHNLANPDSARLLVYENADRVGGTWRQYVASVGDEHHDGAHLVDLDRDGDVDVISIGWNHSNVVWYENRAFIGGSPPPPATAPVNTSPPVINGRAEVDSVLTASPGSWSGNPPPSFVYQWRRCDAAGSGCVAISGATGTSYRLVSADAGSTVRVAVTGSNSAGSATAVSAQTAVVQEAPPPATAPLNTSAPTIGGRAEVGSVLTASAGSWSGEPPPSFVYQWRRCDAAGSGCVAISGATGTSYALVSSDVGSTLRVAVTGSNSAGSTTAVSAQTEVVQEVAAPPGVTVPSLGLRAWFAADRGVLTLDGSSVSGWVDGSGFLTNAAQPFAPAQPVLVPGAVNGLPAVRFDGVNDFLTFSLSPNGLSGMTLVLVSSSRDERDGGWTGAAHAPLFWNETASWGTVHLSPFQSQVKWRFGTGQVGNLPVWLRPASIGSAWSLTTAVKSGTQEALYLGGQLVASQSGKLATIQGIRAVGNLGRGYNDDTFFAGDIAEVLVYDRALSAAERGQLEQYLLTKYGG